MKLHELEKNIGATHRAKRKGLGIKRSPNGLNAITLFFIAQSLKR